MSLLPLSRRSLWAALGATAFVACFSAPALALNKDCNRNYVTQRVQSAMLAFKATQYCSKTPLPFTDLEAIQQLDSLRCNADASAMIDELDRSFDKQYRMIMTTDSAQTVCKHAATLDINQ